MTLLGSLSWPSAGVDVDEEPEDVADRAFPADGFRERQLRLDPIAVATPVLVLHDVARIDQVGDDPVGASLGDIDRCGEVPQPYPWIPGDADQDSGMVGEEAPISHARYSSRILEIDCQNSETDVRSSGMRRSPRRRRPEPPVRKEHHGNVRFHCPRSHRPRRLPLLARTGHALTWRIPRPLQTLPRIESPCGTVDAAAASGPFPAIRTRTPLHSSDGGCVHRAMRPCWAVSALADRDRPE